MSYWPCDINNLVKDKSFEPRIDHKDPLNQHNGPMERETTIRLNYQPVEASLSQSKSWMKNSDYHPSAPPIDDDTTYNSRQQYFSFINLVLLYFIIHKFNDVNFELIE